jgi:hypothetical protein
MASLTEHLKVALIDLGGLIIAVGMVTLLALAILAGIKFFWGLI